MRDALPLVRDDAPGGTAGAAIRGGWRGRAAGAFSAPVGFVSGVAPHVLHHVGPLAGAALLAGATGALLFGILGFLLMVPMLLRLRRRFDTWAAPALALAVFAGVFTVSTLWIGPAIRGEGGGTTAGQPFDHTSHHGG